MNRLLSDDALCFESPASDFGTALGDDRCVARDLATKRRSVNCSMFTPVHYEPGYAYPLVVWLHGVEGDQQQLRRVMPHLSIRNYIAVGPQGLPAGDLADRSCDWPETSAGDQHAAEQVRACLEIAQSRYNVHAERVFIAGYQSGGTAALRLGLAYPEWFAGVISLDGPMPRGRTPLQRINAARGLPLLLAACRESRQYSAQQVDHDLRLLHAAGFSLALRQYPADDGLTTAMLADVDRWIMERVCGAPASSPA